MVLVSNTVELENYINSAINISVTNVTKIASESLKSFINMSFYSEYAPKVYKRTEQFLNSVAVDILKGESTIYIDTIGMLYKDITGDEVVDLAAQGYHGTTDIQTEGRFWDEFTEWCKENLVVLLKSELQKQGLNIN